jgi:UDP-N-acetylglucosamine 2-epimerase (non-hydrolysing)
MSVVHVVGARPNFPKAAPVIEGLATLRVDQTLVHTGQHYDYSLSGSFFEDLEMPPPDVFLGVGSGSHAEQTARVMTSFEEYVSETHRPSLLVVYGDINSTLAVSLVASKLGIPVAHVEAGLRSFDWSMPEEVNRVVTDRVSRLLFVTSPEAIGNLVFEGVDRDWIAFVGNPMIDTLLRYLPVARSVSLVDRLALPEAFALVTLHRPSNVDNVEQARTVVASLREVGELVPLVMPLHPRGRETLFRAGLDQVGNLTTIPPLRYLDFVRAMDLASLVVTDSGGVQEETTMLGTPCLTLRENTERPITLSMGTNRLTSPPRLAADARLALESQTAALGTPPLWDGKAGQRIAMSIADYLARK